MQKCSKPLRSISALLVSSVTVGNPARDQTGTVPTCVGRNSCWQGMEESARFKSKMARQGCKKVREQVRAMTGRFFFCGIVILAVRPSSPWMGACWFEINRLSFELRDSSGSVLVEVDVMLTQIGPGRNRCLCRGGCLLRSVEGAIY